MCVCVCVCVFIDSCIDYLKHLLFYQDMNVIAEGE